MTDVAEIWSYLSAGPLLWLTLTLAAYLLADRIAAAAGRAPWANPVLIAVLILAPLLAVTGTDYATYFEGAQFIHFLLGPATVALAAPLFANLAAVRATALPMAAALVAGSAAGAGSAILMAQWFGLSDAIIASVAPKSTTAPVALGISESLGGLPTLTAALVILTGIIGAVTVTPLMNALGISDFRARGFAVGVAAHGIGTARAFQVNRTAGVYAGAGMALNAILTSLIVPPLLLLLG
ncbi:LrgB family protein [Rhodovulum sp. DZ06]|uniref:LrgB family protein n=1 Tax=Rhodovulum sp. DZ06 TaxID=3425126 RepID=UPI003D32D2A5